MSRPDIRTVESAGDMAMVVDVIQRVWGSPHPIVGVELLRAVDHAGGYVAGAFDGDDIVAASFAFPARLDGEHALHSHVTGVLPGLQQTGIGRALKHHQRAWAAERGIGWITWTFDPLVRRNAWFNLEVLGVVVRDYVVDFYGPLTDSINAHDETDRLVVVWPTDPEQPRPSPPPGSVRLEVATPADVVELRRSDPTDAAGWRRRVRTELGGALDRGGVVTAFTRDGSYVVHVPS